MQSSLIVGVKRLDNRALAELWSTTSDSLLHYAERLFRGTAMGAPDGESAVQSAFISLWKGLGDERFEFSDESGLMAILFTLVRRKVTKQIRAARRQRRGGDVFHVRMDRISDSNPQIDVTDRNPGPMVVAEARDEVDRLLGLLKDNQLLEIALLKMDARTDQEVADGLGISRATVARKLRLIRQIWHTDAAETVN